MKIAAAAITFYFTNNPKVELGFLHNVADI